MGPTRAPFHDWADQLVDDAIGLRAWFVAPRFIVMQLDGPVFDLPRAERMVKVVDETVPLVRSQLRAAGGLVMLYDLRDCHQVTREAERFVQAAWKNIDPHDVAESWVFVWHLDRFAQLVISLVNTAAFVATGKRQRLLEDPAEFFVKHPLHAPPPEQRFPGA